MVRNLHWRRTLAVLIAALVSCHTVSWSQVIIRPALPTNLASNLAINGAGWFVLRDPSSGRIFVTRRGSFCLDTSGYVISDKGYRLQGYCDVALSTVGDLRIDAAGAHSTGTVQSWWFSPDGKVSVVLTDDTEFVAGQVLLQNFRNPELLPRIAYKLYALARAAGPLPAASAPGSAGLGDLLSGQLDGTPEPVRLTLFPSASKTGPLTEGILTDTCIPTDLGIEGAGFFLVRDTNSSALFATRAGTFLRDAEGYLVTYDRLRVQGYSDPTLSNPGDVRIDETGSPIISSLGAAVESFQVEQDGKVICTLDDGTTFVRGQVRLSTFAHPELLTPTNHGLYAGVLQAQPQPIATSYLHQFALELINVPENLLAQRDTLTFFTQGSLTNDNIVTHLALSGNGFFLLRDPSDNRQYVARIGVFQLDANGYLVSSNGLRVQGHNTPARTTIGDVRVDSAGSASALSAYSFYEDGRIVVVLADGTQFIRGQILLQNFREPFLLRSTGTSLYTNLAAAGPRAQPGAPDTAGLGKVQCGAVESLDLTEPLTLPSRSGVRLIITGEPRRRWTIEAATQLNEWTTLTQLTNTSGALEFSDTESAHLNQRFYRVVISDP